MTLITPLVKPATPALCTGPDSLTYPRAGVRESRAVWFILIDQGNDICYLLRETRLPGDPLMTFDTRHAAMTHAAREIHALRARRHPAGQSWLRGKGAVR